MSEHLSVTKFLKEGKVHVSAPCRLDCGGTLDLMTFYVPLARCLPSTFNLALDLRTHVRLRPFDEGLVRVSSKGIGEESYPAGEAPFDTDLGMFFAAAEGMSVAGLSIEIESQSPPRSALGGSSTALLAVVAALDYIVSAMGRKGMTRPETVQMAYDIESGLAGVPCGMQDHLAAAYGGVNQWVWRIGPSMRFVRRVLAPKRLYKELMSRILVAYPGMPHESVQVNSLWVKGFVSGERRRDWEEICALTSRFCRALAEGRWTDAAGAMNAEVDIRLDMTPEVLTDEAGTLVALARDMGCGARFTGAGGGGCVWALGEEDQVKSLKREWQRALKGFDGGKLLPAEVTAQGVVVH